MFILVSASVQRKLVAELRATEMLWAFPSRGDGISSNGAGTDVEVVPFSCMDGIAVPIKSYYDEIQLFADVEVACSLFLKLAASCGLEVSLLAGKSEASLQLVGRCAEAGRRLLAEFELDEAGVSPLFPTPDGGHARVVVCYRPLARRSPRVCRSPGRFRSGPLRAALARTYLAKCTVDVSGRSLVLRAFAFVVLGGQLAAVDQVSDESSVWGLFQAFEDDCWGGWASSRCLRQSFDRCRGSVHLNATC